eukprot:244648-Amorphochlora_amoeboformis.AAC.1
MKQHSDSPTSKGRVWEEGSTETPCSCVSIIAAQKGLRPRKSGLGGEVKARKPYHLHNLKISVIERLFLTPAGAAMINEREIAKLPARRTILFGTEQGREWWS